MAQPNSKVKRRLIDELEASTSNSKNKKQNVGQNGCVVKKKATRINKNGKKIADPVKKIALYGLRWFKLNVSKY